MKLTIFAFALIATFVNCQDNRRTSHSLIGTWQATLQPFDTNKSITLTRILEFNDETAGRVTLKFVYPQPNLSIELTAPFQYKQEQTFVELELGVAQCNFNKVPQGGEMYAKIGCENWVKSLSNRKERESLISVNDNIMSTVCGKEHLLEEGLKLTYKKI